MHLSDIMHKIIEEEILENNREKFSLNFSLLFLKFLNLNLWSKIIAKHVVIF